MSRSIALLSGKGGSGKTTFALALANMLSSCKIKVLLVDCDIVTNGATYFYEDRLSGDNPVASFFDLLYSKDVKVFSPMEIVPSYYYFIPSIHNITNDITDSHPFDPQIKQEFKELYSIWEKDFDVILFDCSAGYSDVLHYVVPEADINLVVLESDKVSMAAMRSLYLKLGPILNKTKFYQIFNKVRPEEVDEYKRRDGTFFTSIGAIAFDWSIRDAFAVADVPTLDNTGIDFGMQLNNICSTLFEGNSYLSKLKQYGLELSLRKVRIEQEETRSSFINYRSDRKKPFWPQMTAIWIPLLILSSISLLLLLLLGSGLFPLGFGDLTSSKESILVTIIAAFATNILGSILIFFESSTSSKERRLKLKAYEDQLNSQQERINKIKRMLEKS